MLYRIYTGSPYKSTDLGALLQHDLTEDQVSGYLDSHSELLNEWKRRFYMPPHIDAYHNGDYMGTIWTWNWADWVKAGIWREPVDTMP